VLQKYLLKKKSKIYQLKKFTLSKSNQTTTHRKSLTSSSTAINTRKKRAENKMQSKQLVVSGLENTFRLVICIPCRVISRQNYRMRNYYCGPSTIFLLDSLLECLAFLAMINRLLEEGGYRWNVRDGLE
jgi:hypothetical protein